MSERKYKIAIIGGGASGMMAAISAGRVIPGEDIVLIEKNDRLGRKILATGNGRCNFSNINCSWKDYGGQDPLLVKEAFKSLSPKDTISLFEELGILSKEESEGRLYPYTEQAASIKQSLELKLKDLNVSIILGYKVKDVRIIEKGFEIILTYGKTVSAQNVILATGGKAGSQFGSTGDGYLIAERLGHSLNTPLPGLVQMTSEDESFKELKGVRAKGRVTLLQANNVLDSELGEIQFTEDGLSGICIFNLSRYLKPHIKDYFVDIDLFPSYDEKALLEKLAYRKKHLKDRKVENFLFGILKDKLVPVYLKRWGIDDRLPVETLSFDDLRHLVKVLKSWIVAINGTRSWENAQVTLGGIKSSEVNRQTLESKLVPGLFFAGEILDVDGKCGGWNLQWAWSSGYLAGSKASIK
ncbi:MAG: NAD(P)/FAD-dependent oxidoreductase [Clostridiales bacterium]|nr:NAD(P)/FAD-dependent oxidoreductase [Clostridiales bacterium]